MSDFDDEPEEGSEATEEPAAARPPKKARPAPVADDDWDDDWDDDDDGGRGGKRDLTLVYAIVAAAIVIVLAVVLTRPKDDNSGTNTGNGGNAAATTQAEAPSKNWQGPVGDAVGADGADAQKRAESGPGVYIWTDFGGWHLRANGDKEVKVAVVAPQVRTSEDGEFEEQADITLPAGNGSTGADLDLGGSESASFTVTIDGTNVPADQIFLGGGDGVADANPVAFVKA